MTKKKVDLLIINASELITLKGPERPRHGQELGEIGIISNGAVAVISGKIVSVGLSREIEKEYSSENTINATGKTVMPGFIDAHTHLIFAGSRENELQKKLEGKSYMEIMKSGGGILSTVKVTRKASKHQLIREASKRLEKMLAYGTTSLEAKTGYGLTVADELKSLEVLSELKKSTCQDIVPTFMGAHAIPPEFKNSDDYVDLVVIEMLPAIRKKAVFCDVFCEKGAFTVEQAKRILNYARDDGLGLKLHADEFGDTGGAGLAAEIGAVSAEHLLHSGREGIIRMASKGVIGVLLPVSAFTLMNGKYADARGMIDAGLPIALGTDLCPNSWTESMQFVISLACYNMRMTPAEAVCAATINSAYATGLGITHGSLEPGKRADILVLDAPNHMYLAYHMGVNLVEKVIKNGKTVV